MLPQVKHQPKTEVNELFIFVFQQELEQVWEGHHWIGFERCTVWQIFTEKMNVIIRVPSLMRK
jgi:hypothetical protein